LLIGPVIGHRSRKPLFALHKAGDRPTFVSEVADQAICPTIAPPLPHCPAVITTPLHFGNCCRHLENASPTPHFSCSLPSAKMYIAAPSLARSVENFSSLQPISKLLCLTLPSALNKNLFATRHQSSSTTNCAPLPSLPLPWLITDNHLPTVTPTVTRSSLSALFLEKTGQLGLRS